MLHHEIHRELEEKRRTTCKNMTAAGTTRGIFDRITRPLFDASDRPIGAERHDSATPARTLTVFSVYSIV
jgi:hypothetical protein